MAKRLTERHKRELVENFESGKSIDFLSKLFDCTKLTVTRNLQKILGEFKYREIINKNKNLNSQSAQKEKFKDISSDNDSYFGGNTSINNSSDFFTEESFFEIAPLDYEIDKSSRKELSSVPISDIDLPKIVYMIVDKKIELEIKLLKDFPAWEFLPDDDLNRKTFEIFFDLNLAKKSCNKDQKVLKVPNTNVFRIAAPVLLAKGISRIVCPENLIAL